MWLVLTHSSPLTQHTTLVHKCGHCFCGLDWVFISSPAFLFQVQKQALFFSEVRPAPPAERESWRRGDRDGGRGDGEAGEGGESRPWRPSQRWKSDR